MSVAAERNISESRITSYVNKVHEILPGAKIFKLRGYSGRNIDYQKAKTPPYGYKWQDEDGLAESEIVSWLNKDGWVGAVIPQGVIVIDIDNYFQGEYVKELLEGECVNHHAIKTPNGWQFVLKSETVETKAVKQIAKYYTQIGAVIDTRTSEKGYIVFPTENTKGRFVVTRSDSLDELPHYLRPIRNTVNVKDYSFPIPIEGEGSRNNTLYNFASHLRAWKVSDYELRKSMELIYEYFVLDKDGFPESELNTIIKSVLQWNPEPITNMRSTIEEDFGKDNFDESDSEELKYTTPDPYDIKNNMLIKREFRELVSGIKVIEKDVSRIAHIFITKELSNIERNSIHYEIAWKDRGVIKKEIVPGKTISTKKELIDLSDKGLPVNDNNYKHFIDYFDRFIAVNELKQCRMVERLGRINNYFIHPLNSLDIEIVPSGAGEKQLLESFQVKGTVDSWVREVFYRIKDHPKVLFMVLASLASSILQDLKVDTFIVDLSGSTSQGKTTALQVARSVWGTERLVSEWNATKVSIERKASFLNSFPLYLDDTRKANEKIIQPIIYQFSGGSEKGRGSIKGSQREETWNNILLSTGEVPITEYAKRAGGVAARVIPLIDQPFESVDHHYFSDIYKAIDENCGAIGLEFIKNWSEQKESLIPDFHKVKEYYITKSKENEVLTRVSRYYAAVHFTGFILKKIFKLDFNLKSLDRLFDEIARENKALDKPRELLEEILKDLNSSRENILYDYDPRLKTNAIYYKGTIWLLPAYLSEMLGVEERMIRTEWGKRGYILLHDDKKSGNKVDTKLVKRRGKAIRAMCVNPAIIEELGYNFEINYSEEFEEEFNQQLKVTKTLKR